MGFVDWWARRLAIIFWGHLLSGLSNVNVDVSVSTTANSIIQTARVSADNMEDPASGNVVVLSTNRDLFSFTAKPFEHGQAKLDSFTVSFNDFCVEVTGIAAGRDAGFHGSFGGSFSIAGIHLHGFSTSSTGLACEPLRLAFPNTTHKFNTDPSNFSVSINGGPPAFRDPAILAVVAGDSSFEIRCDTFPKVDFNAIKNGIVLLKGAISISYEFTTYPPRQPFSILRIGRTLAELALKKRDTSSR